MGVGVTTFGRADDNGVAFADDSNVSRYHAEIERRADEFWLIDLGSSNGTSVNGQTVAGEALLKDGDRIAFGGTSVVTIEFIEEKAETDSSAPSAASGNADAGEKQEKQIEQDSETASKTPKMLMFAGVACGLAVICAVGAGLFYSTREAPCEARAVITKPEPGETLLAATEIEVDLADGGCVARAIFTLDGVEIARATEKPFGATLDPKQFPDLADGFEHNLQIVLEDARGNRIVQPDLVALAFETREIATPTPTPEIVKADGKPTPKNAPNNRAVSLIDVQEMSKRLVKQFAGNFSYNVSNKQFLQEVKKKTAEYAQEGYFERAAPFRDVINTAYVREQNLDAPLGFVLAMSRSKFVPTRQGSEEGLFRMSNDFVAANAYNGLCGAETLSDASQNCAAKASSLYMKAIVFGVFDGDVLYSAAAFGKSPQDAGAWKASLPADRADLWNAIKTPAEREQIVRFFAAGIVAENPQKFGLKKDRPLSELYRVTM